MSQSTALPANTLPSSRQLRHSLSLKDMLEDGIYLLLLLQAGNAPKDGAAFAQQVQTFLAQFDSNARKLGKDETAVSSAKYAFCALLDEVILSSSFDMRAAWEGAPLQLQLFGEHLAGEHFFERLDALRGDPKSNLEVLEVFHTCLLLGFRGKYLIEGTEKLQLLTARLEQELIQARGGKAEFAPHWRLPQRLQQYLKHELPLWTYFALLALAGATVFLSFAWLLDREAGGFVRQSADRPLFMRIDGQNNTPANGPQPARPQM
ncbi:type VI secretion system protein ImpK [Noviherbaspirillum humi]|uniref:Type VI secretion system protein ImpK n=1 Tax=Noviherbaspirillum humi TaxID=1688639 RepID=A0A239DLT7_9BURK|nr:type IVB secretion system protein IcmH/DotU [Noviherbaspirillum humi]SNS32633.1 type VI secretion system protein ImpK [Noviherbaspirillum humi]